MINQRWVKMFSLIVLLSFATTLLSGIVAAQNPVIDPLMDLFTFQTDLSISTNISKYLFIILLSFLIWGVIDTSGIVGNSGVKWAVSIMVSFLAVSYLGTEDIIGLLETYSALSMTILFLFPIVILFFFTIRVISSGGPSGVILQYGAWMLYFLFLVYKFISDVVIAKRLSTDSPTTWIFLAAIVISFVMVVGNAVVMRWFGKKIVKTEIENYQKAAERIATVRRSYLDEFNNSTKKSK